MTQRRMDTMSDTVPLQEFRAVQTACEGFRKVLTDLLPEPLLWREDGEGMIFISVHKKDLRAARAALTAGKSNAAG